MGKGCSLVLAWVMEKFDREEVTSKVLVILEEVLNLRDGSPALEARLIEDLGAESVDMLSLLLEFEEAFGFEIPDEDQPRLATPNSIVDYILSMNETAQS